MPYATTPATKHDNPFRIVCERLAVQNQHEPGGNAPVLTATTPAWIAVPVLIRTAVRIQFNG